MIERYIETNKKLVEDYLETILHSPNEEYKNLYEAMNYSLLLGGKRIRPILTKAVLESFGLTWDDYKDVVCAIELIHSYSLVHDDLPAMDNDDYRRGKLTNHKVYGEGMAILAGDGLLTAAFELISGNQVVKPQDLIKIIHILAKGAGPSGMVGGQAFDLSSEGKILPLEELQVLHRGKTGALFHGAIEIGLILSGAKEDTYAAFIDYAEALGLLFQITDDILDVTGTVEELGKTPGSDIRQDKATYVSILGLDGAKAKANETADLAKAALSKTEANTEVLAALIDYLVHRTH